VPATRQVERVPFQRQGSAGNRASRSRIARGREWPFAGDSPWRAYFSTSREVRRPTGCGGMFQRNPTGSKPPRGIYIYRSWTFVSAHYLAKDRTLSPETMSTVGSLPEQSAPCAVMLKDVRLRKRKLKKETSVGVYMSAMAISTAFRDNGKRTYLNKRVSR
jgi:hypothetical protein